MHIARDILSEKQLPNTLVELTGVTFEKAFRATLLADAIARTLAVQYGVPFPQTPLIAEFKRRMA
jgi:hypothetical protein